eukprot:COSAG04_NODE_67_length_29431_cov_17.894313_9_plen_272_part_00
MPTYVIDHLKRAVAPPPPLGDLSATGSSEMEDTGKLSNAAGSVATARTHTTGKSSGRRMSASTARTSVHYLSANSRKCLPFFSRGGVQPHKPPMALPGHYDPVTKQCVVKNDLQEQSQKNHHYVDGDGDGAVSRVEFARWFWRKQGRCPKEAEWQAFAAADVNQDGTITNMEFENYLARTFGPKAKPRDEKEEMSLEDSLDEFTDMYKQIHQSPRDKYRKPQTSSQVVGWDGREQKKFAKPTCSPRQHMPRKTCPETQFGTVYACVATEAS